jgi:hypothetical protein
MAGLSLKPLFAKGVKCGGALFILDLHNSMVTTGGNVSVWSRSPKAANVVCAHNFS